jgi:hypothetical protein
VPRNDKRGGSLRAEGVAIQKPNLFTPALQCGIMKRNNTKTVAVESSQRYKVLTRYEAEILRAAVPDVLGRAGTGI